MKTRTLFLALLSTFAYCAYAQTESAEYLSKAMASMNSGDCRSALMFYNVYKDLDGKPLSSFERLIEDCVNGNDSTKTFNVGDVIRIGNDLYTVAYTTNKGKHGFAICEMGSGPITKELIKERKIPTWSEFEIMKTNNSIIKLSGSYWTTEPANCSNCECYKVFGLGSFGNAQDCAQNRRSIIYIHRF